MYIPALDRLHEGTRFVLVVLSAAAEEAVDAAAAAAAASVTARLMVGTERCHCVGLNVAPWTRRRAAE